MMSSTFIVQTALARWYESPVLVLLFWSYCTAAFLVAYNTFEIVDVSPSSVLCPSRNLKDFCGSMLHAIEYFAK